MKSFYNLRNRNIKIIIKCVTEFSNHKKIKMQASNKNIIKQMQYYNRVVVKNKTNN